MFSDSDSQIQSEGLRIANAAGTRFYGMHFYPGVADYKEPFAGRIFINEQTIRDMGPSFTGRPVFVMHVDDVEQDKDKLRGQVDGWVVESFFNKADGKHWAHFIVVSERGEDAIRQGYRLSNAYAADKMSAGGVWNDVPYDAEVVEGHYEHLALVPVPRYSDVPAVMTPEKFKAYCSERELEIQRISNSGEHKPMALSIFKRTKVENGVDLETMLVVLPKSKKEVSLAGAVEAADTHFVNAAHGMAHPDHMVDMGEGVKMSVKDMAGKYKAMGEEMAKNAKEKEDADKDDDKDMENDGDYDTADSPGNVTGTNETELAEEDKEPQKELPKAEKPKNSSDKKAEKTAEDASKKAAKAAADRVRNAGSHVEVAHVNFAMDQVSRGKAKYGSG